MRRRLFTVCSSLSLLLFAAVCVLWVRSYYVSDRLTHRRLDRDADTLRTAELHLRTGAGHAAVAFSRDTSLDVSDGSQPSPADAPGWSRATDRVADPAADAADRPTLPGRLGFATTRAAGVTPQSYQSTSVSFPLWAVALALAVPPAAYARSAIRSWRGARRGLCRTCGYDLRASPERCPECGTPARR